MKAVGYDASGAPVRLLTGSPAFVRANAAAGLDWRNATAATPPLFAAADAPAKDKLPVLVAK